MDEEHRTESGYAIDNPQDDCESDDDNDQSTFPFIETDDVGLLRKMLAKSHRNNKELMEDFDNLLALYHAEKHQGQIPVVQEEKVSLKPNKEKEAMQSLEVTLKETKSKLKSAEKREVQVKTELKLKSSATHRAVLDRIQEYREGKTLTTKKLNKLKEDYTAIKEEKAELQRKLADMENTKRRIELTSEQRHEDMGKQLRRKKLMDLQRSLPGLQLSVETATKSVDRRPGTTSKGNERKHRIPSSTARQVSQPARSGPERPVAPLSAKPTPSATRVRCVLCREAFPPLMAGRDVDYCYIHYHTFRDGKWGCCGSEGDSSGCLRIPHLRVEIGAKHSIIVTDGMRKLCLS